MHIWVVGIRVCEWARAEKIKVFRYWSGRRIVINWLDILDSTIFIRLSILWCIHA